MYDFISFYFCLGDVARKRAGSETREIVTPYKALGSYSK